MDRQPHKGIWRYARLLPPVSSSSRVTLNEGQTSLKRYGNIFFKCEFENPTGSVKDRSLAYQISRLKEKGIKKAVISSSGNAAISAANYCKLADISLTVFVSPKICKSKLNVLQELSCKIITDPRPISASFRFALTNSCYNLRQSKDPNAVYGYTTIAYELNLEKEIDAVFIPVSSGTTLVGVSLGFAKKHVFPAIHAVQTQAVNPVSSLFDKEFRPAEKSLADGIVAKQTARLDKIVEIIKSSHGFAWVISDGEIKKAHEKLESYKLPCANEGAAALASVWKAQKKGFVYRHPVCLLTGKYYQCE